MFQEMERTYRTAQEEELTNNVKILKILLIILIVSSGALLIFFIFHLFLEYEPIYTIRYFDGKVTSAFSNVFYGITGIQYPTTLILAIFLLKIARKQIREIKIKMYVISILILSVTGINLIYTLIAGIFYVFNNPMSEEYTRFINVQFIFSFYTDYLMITIGVILVSIILLEMKRLQIFSKQITITPFIQGGIFVVWVIMVLAYRISGAGLQYGFMLVINIFSCLFAISMIATFTEFLVRLKNIDVPQIIAMTEKLP